MTTKTNSAEGGVNGTLVNEANSGGTSGDASSNRYIGAGSSLAFSTSSPIQGLVSYLATFISTETVIWEWTGFNAAPSGLSHIGARYTIRTPATYGATTEILSIRSAAAKAASLRLTSGGRIQVFDKDETADLASFTTVLDASTEYDVALWVEEGTTTTNGKIKAGFYLKGSPTPLETVYSATNRNTGTADLTVVRFGKIGASTWAGTLPFDNLQAADTYTDLPTTTVAAPTIVLLTGFRYVVNAGTSTPGAGGGLTFSTTNISGPTLTYDTIGGGFGFIPHATLPATYRITVSEAGGGTATQDVVIPAAAATSGLGDTYSETVVLDTDGTTWV